MTPATQPVDLTAAPRAARGNAWEAVCADRERARHRAEVRRMLSRARATH